MKKIKIKELYDELVFRNSSDTLYFIVAQDYENYNILDKVFQDGDTTVNGIQFLNWLNSTILVIGGNGNNTDCMTIEFDEESGLSYLSDIEDFIETFIEDYYSSDITDLYVFNEEDIDLMMSVR